MYALERFIEHCLKNREIVVNKLPVSRTYIKRAIKKIFYMVFD